LPQFYCLDIAYSCYSDVVLYGSYFNCFLWAHNSGDKCKWK